MFFTVPASAYIDPATTAMLTQIIAGLFITLGVVFGVFRRKIILFFKNASVNRTKRKIEKQVKKQTNDQSNEKKAEQTDNQNGENKTEPDEESASE